MLNRLDKCLKRDESGDTSQRLGIDPKMFLDAYWECTDFVVKKFICIGLLKKFSTELQKKLVAFW